MDARSRRPQGHRRHSRGPALLAAVVSLLLSGCTLLGAADDPTTAPTDPPTDRTTPQSESTTQQAEAREGTLLPEGTVEVDVAAGESVQVALPEGSLGVGDFWGVASVSDPAVAEADIAIGEDVVGVEPADDESPEPVGGTQQFAVEIEGLEPGTTTVRVLYCTRVHEVTEDCDQTQGTLDAPVEPVEIEVRVE